jgi:hypothetical protein
MLALPIAKMLYIYLLCPHSEHQKNSFQSKPSNTFTKESGSSNVKPVVKDKTSKSWVQCARPCPVGAGPNKVLTLYLAFLHCVQYFFLEQKLLFFHSFIPREREGIRDFLLLSIMKTFIEVAPCWLQHKLYFF